MNLIGKLFSGELFVILIKKVSLLSLSKSTRVCISIVLDDSLGANPNIPSELRKSVPTVALPWPVNTLNSTDDAISVDPLLVTVNTAVSPSVTSISLILYTSFGALVPVPIWGTPPVNPTVVFLSGLPVYASSQTYCV